MTRVRAPAGRPEGRWCASIFAVGASLLVGGCSDGVMAPASPEAEVIAGIGWFMYAVSAGIFALVVVLLGWAVIRGRREHEPGGSGVGLVVLGGVVLPAIVLPILWFISLPAMADLVGGGEPADLEVEITGHRWYYEVHYPDAGVTLRDELHLPLDEQVRLRVTSADVIHSFWVPELAGKRDMLPGKVNELTLRPTEAGRYEAHCAEFCGIGHAGMDMPVIVEPREELETWLAEQRPAESPAP